jgi:hypothetical protein
MASCPSTQFYKSDSYIAEIWSWFSIGYVESDICPRICVSIHQQSQFRETDLSFWSATGPSSSSSASLSASATSGSVNSKETISSR